MTMLAVDPSQPLSLLAMLTIGFLGSGHCVGMCGGIATGLGLASQGKRSASLVIGYNVGRVSSYAVAGFLVALLGYWGRNYLALGPWLRIIAGIILVLMGVHLAGWWRSLLWLEKAGGRVWRKIQPLGKRIMPVETFFHAYALGLVWGWLPCGLVYTALAYAATSSSPLNGGLMMLAFGLGTAPSMVAGGLFSTALKTFFQKKPIRLLLAFMMLIFGAWTLYGASNHLIGQLNDQPQGQHHQHH